MRYKAPMFEKLSKILVLIVFLMSLGAVGAELKGELSGPRLIPNKQMERVLEYTCTALANDEEARSVRMRIRPKSRAVTLFLGQGVTVEGTASRTRVPSEEKIVYTFLNSLENYRFKLVFSTTKSGDKAELRLASGDDAISCALDESVPNLAD